MSDVNWLLLLCLFEILGGSVLCGNIPCNPRELQYGYVCVCNETYCDTIEQPTPLARGSFYHYRTSQQSPGFNFNIGQFLNYSRLANPERSDDVYIKVNSSICLQTVEGFGASFTASSGMMVNSLPSASREKLIESYFGPSGIEYTFARVPVAAADFSPQIYTYDDVPGDVELKYFNLTRADFDLKIPLLKMATNASKRGMRLLGSSWTAPNWMKTNNGQKAGYIYNKYLGVWANYHLKFLEAYKQNGIEFWGLTQGNEVMIALFFGPWFPIQNTMFPPLQSRYWTKNYLGPLLKSSGYENLKLLILDDERPFMSYYTDRVLSDKEAADYIDGVALHWYLDSSSNIQNLQEFHSKYPDKFMLYTEASISQFNARGGGAVDLGDWNRAERYLVSIIQNLNHWVVGYIDWNMALNQDGGPTGPANLTLDAAIIVNNTNGEFYKQPLFYVLGHFSKFLPPGAKIINVTIKQDLPDGQMYFNKDNFISRLLLYRRHYYNESLYSPSAGVPPTYTPTTTAPFPTRKPDPQVTTVIALASLNPDGSRTVIAYNPKSIPVNLVIEDSEVGTLNQAVEAYSINTFVYW